MNLKSITEESKGTVAAGDIIVMIGDDDITGWTLTRGCIYKYSKSF